MTMADLLETFEAAEAACPEEKRDEFRKEVRRAIARTDPDSRVWEKFQADEAEQQRIENAQRNAAVVASIKESFEAMKARLSEEPK